MEQSDDAARQGSVLVWLRLSQKSVNFTCVVLSVTI